MALSSKKSDTHKIYTAISTSVVAGSSLVFPSELYDPAATLECIERYKCAALYGVTTMFIAEMSHSSFPNIDKSSLKYVSVSYSHSSRSQTLTKILSGAGSVLWLAQPCPQRSYDG